MSNILPFRRSRRLTAEERRNLTTGMRKLFDPILDRHFDDLLHAVARASG